MIITEILFRTTQKIKLKFEKTVWVKSKNTLNMAIVYKEVSYIKKHRNETREEIIIPGYYHAKYGDLDVIINEDGLFNLAKICYLYVDENGKRSKKYPNWYEGNEDRVEEFRRLHIKEGGNPDKFLYKVGGSNHVKGTYGIAEIAIKVAGYTCANFEWRMMKIIKDLNITNAQLNSNFQTIAEKYATTSIACRKLLQKNNYPLFAATGCLYIATFPQEDNVERYKVGITKNPNKRFGTYRTSSPNITIKFMVYLESTQKSRKRLENVVKAHFIDERWDMSHEWYEIAYEELLFFIQACLRTMPHTIDQDLEKYNKFIRELTTGTVGTTLASLPPEITDEILDESDTDSE